MGVERGIVANFCNVYFSKIPNTRKSCSPSLPCCCSPPQFPNILLKIDTSYIKVLDPSTVVFYHDFNIDLFLKVLKLHLVHISIPKYIHILYSLHTPSQRFYLYGCLLMEPFCILCQAIFESQNLKEEIQLSEKYTCTNRSCTFFHQTLKAQCIVAQMHTQVFLLMHFKVLM